MEIYAVSHVTRRIKDLLESDAVLSDVWISGEVSNFVLSQAGHAYFTLKDGGAALRSVLFRGQISRRTLLPQNGQAVIAHGRISVYEPQGGYQLYVDLVQPEGVGLLHLQFEELRGRLEREGLFDPERKRILPRFPRVVGVVTSPSGAVIRDIINVVSRRFPGVELVLAPTPVQGDEAPERIVAALELLNHDVRPDVIIVARGGGSLEDLWSFNDERVARAIAASEIPVISGVGHETDITIADFIADLRAPTPTAAAEMAATPTQDWLAELRQQAIELTDGLRHLLNDHSQSLDWLAHRLISPSMAIDHQKLKLSNLANRLRHGAITRIAGARFRIEQVRSRLHHALPDTRIRRARLGAKAVQLHTAFSSRLTTWQHGLESASGQLELLAPQRTLKRGYAILSDESGRVLRQPDEIKPPQRLKVTLAGGTTLVDISARTSSND